MRTAEARVETERPSRYLVQLCKHFDNKGRQLGHRPRAHNGGDAQALREMQAVAAQAQVEWSETRGTVSLPWGRCALQADPGALTVHVEAVDEENLGRLQDLVSGHIERFGRREQLEVTWLEAVAESPGQAISAAPVPSGGVARRRSRGRTTALATVGVLAVAVHLGLGGVLLANWRWTGWAVGALLAVVLVKVTVLTGLGRFVVRRGKAPKAH
ncbi:DUF2218 domain-containing protein (plasmid) [Streptomyces mirabilis]|uniref:DUF2218 domain-containing protein n=1 Tax=Streptomyces mirabilis TaxID=68239 RepID=UPI001BAFA581|nr:DUF2218 domain-containing protein [Streptomyces mirabilis]QUW85495.1 DUF2218 domain-containing protein [Streptomyces mirabilis]